MINKVRLQQWCNKYELTLVDDGNDRYLIPVIDILKYTKYDHVKSVVAKVPRSQRILKRISNNHNTTVKTCFDLHIVVDIVRKYGEINNEFYKEIYDIYNDVPMTQNSNQCNDTKNNGFIIKQILINELSSKFKEQQSSKSPESVSIEIQSAQHIGTEIKIMCTITIKDIK